jgi:predicted ATPase
VQVLVDVMPEVAAIIGPQPPVPVLAPTEAKVRFERTVISFVQVFTSKFSTILFLDGTRTPLSLFRNQLIFILDMQWADPSSVGLLESMMLNTTMKSILIVCAFRDNEINDTHPFKLLIEQIKDKRKNVFQTKLSELNVNSIANLIMDACHCTEQKALPFVELVCRQILYLT